MVADGTLTMHGTPQKIKQAGTLTIANGKISLKSVFKIKPKPFGIVVPEGIADTLEVTVESNF